MTSTAQDDAPTYKVSFSHAAGTFYEQPQFSRSGNASLASIVSTSKGRETQIWAQRLIRPLILVASS